MILIWVALAARAQGVSYYAFEHVQQVLQQRSDTVYVINFWATWCKPCVEELPYFKAADSACDNKPVRFIFLSLDTESRWVGNLQPFAEQHLTGLEVWALYNARPVDWIDQIEPAWSGAIPATLFLHGSSGERIFAESSLNTEEILNNVDTLLNNQNK